MWSWFIYDSLPNHMAPIDLWNSKRRLACKAWPMFMAEKDLGTSCYGLPEQKSVVTWNSSESRFPSSSEKCKLDIHWENRTLVCWIYLSLIIYATNNFPQSYEYWIVPHPIKNIKIIYPFRNIVKLRTNKIKWKIQTWGHIPNSSG